MVSALKLGAKPSRFTQVHFGKAKLLADAFNNLGAPPSNSNHWIDPVVQAIGNNWGMCGNDSVGDCMIADTAHRIMLASANTYGAANMILPDDDYCLSVYEKESGYDPSDPSTDDGTTEDALTGWLKDNQFDSESLLAHAPVNIGLPDHMKWTVQRFGGIRLCLNLPNMAFDLFQKGEPWDIDPLGQDGGIAGGHDILGAIYRTDIFYCVTWGKLIPVTLAFLNKYLFEAHAEIWSPWLNAAGETPLGDNLSALIRDLNAVE